MKPVFFCNLLLVIFACVLVACNPIPAPSPIPTDTELPTATVLTQPSETFSATQTFPPTPTERPLQARFAVIGDYGLGSTAEADVAALVHIWQPDIIITLGDNNYPVGAADVIDAHIGQYYHEYISPYSGVFGTGASENRFFPSLGNHDWITDSGQPYLEYFSLPGNERYYDFLWGPVHFFALNSDWREPDGVNSASIQAAWLEEQIKSSTSMWKVVYFHAPPYSSGYHGSTDWMRWPFADWGADAVLSGHDHVYERLLVNGIPYFVNGLGGAGIYNFNDPLPESLFRYNADNGAMLVTATQTELLFEFYSRTGRLIESYQVTKP